MLYNQTKYMKVRTRNAPSPTGYAHLATIYQSMINKAIALKNNGVYILRIEDTDQNRYVEGAVDAVFEALEWFDLDPNESVRHGGDYGPYVQSERLNLYKKYAEELVEKGYAYYCFCSEERLKELREEQIKSKVPPMYDGFCRNIEISEAKRRKENGEKYVVRLKVPKNEKITVNDYIRGEIEFDSNTIDDQVLLKSDGYPTYHLAVVVDDHLMGISHTVRGPEYVTSFPKHKLLYDFFGWEMPIFIHTPLITNMDNSKLSKRQGHASSDWYRRKGFLPDAVLNFIALLGWSHPEEKEFFTYEEFVKVFDPKDLSALSPKLDLVKLEWMNSQYIQKLNDDEFIKRLKEWLEYCYSSKYKGATEYETHWEKTDYKLLLEFINSLPEEKQLKFAEINKQRIKKFEDLLPLNDFFIKERPIDRELLETYKKGTEFMAHINWVYILLKDSDWSLESLKDIETKVSTKANDLGWKVIEVFFPIRVLVAKSKISPPLFESMWIMGKEKVLKSFVYYTNL